jgi:hypothetical protein
MTRRSILLLVILLVALYIVPQSTVVTAHDVCGDPPGDWCAALSNPAGAGPIVVDPATGTPAQDMQGFVLTPLRGHEHVVIALAQPVSAATGMRPPDDDGALVALAMANDRADNARSVLVSEPNAMTLGIVSCR